jgi:hypothetical protein
LACGYGYYLEFSGVGGNYVQALTAYGTCGA